MTYRLVWAGLCLMCVSAGVCRAQAPQTSDNDQLDTLVSPAAPNRYTFTVYWENDGAILKRNNASDRHYTNGNAITLAHQPDWARGFADVASLGENFDRTAAGYIIGQLIFTPESTAVSSLLSKDRPYAGYLFGGVYLQRANDHTFDHAQLDIGVVGPSSQADHFQNDIHDWLDLDEPKGWNNQIGDEVTAQLLLRRKWRIDLAPVELADTHLSQQLIPQAELAVGSVYRHVSAGATWRIGHNLPDDFGPGRLADVSSATGAPTPGRGAYLFGRVSGRAVEHNLFLEGNSFKDSHGVDADPFVGEIQAGVAAFCHYNGWVIEANYSQTFITRQFQGQDGPDSFGAVMFSASRGF